MKTSGASHRPGIESPSHRAFFHGLLIPRADDDLLLLFLSSPTMVERTMSRDIASLDTGRRRQIIVRALTLHAIESSSMACLFDARMMICSFVWPTVRRVCETKKTQSYGSSVSPPFVRSRVKDPEE